jgi:hypothetical protein
VKKITIVILTAVYLLSAIGVSASSFYCCGVLKSTTLSIGEVHIADAKALATDNHCCKHTKQNFKVKDNHFGSDALSLSVKFFPITIETVVPNELNTEPFTAIHTAFNSHAPPSAQHEPIYTLNCAYRI